MGDKCNCYRFSPRDSLSGAVAQIADYLSKHPGWNETELRAFVDGLISSAGVETFNGRSGNVTLNKDDVNNLLIANCYFAEADETIESIDVLALYKLGIRIVFTQYSSEVDGYTLAYGIEYYPGTDTAKAYLFSSGGGGGTGAIVSVNGKTGTVVLKASDILMNNGDSVEDAVSSAKTLADGANRAAENAVNIANNAISKANAAYSPENVPPYPVTKVNEKVGAVTVKTVDVTNGDSQDPNAYIFIDENENYEYDVNVLTFDMIYPVGSIYMSINSVNPASLFGGTWEQLQDRFLLGAGSTYSAGSVGGEEEHTLAESELPLLNGSISMHGEGAGGSVVAGVSGVFSSGTVETGYQSGTISPGASSISRINFNVGGGAAHNNMPPYLAVYMWKRVA